MQTSLHFYDSKALLERLTNGLKKRDQEVVFLVGSPLSTPMEPGLPGVPDVNGVIELIRSEFADDPVQLLALEEDLKLAGENRYQSAFLFLLGRRGPQMANELVRKAVRAARLPGAMFSDTPGQSLSDDLCRAIDLDGEGWGLSRGTEALGKLIASYPERFGRSLLTTNFDPLIEVAIRRAHGNCFRTTLHSDGDFSHSEGDALTCHVIHLHGYWYGSDTLHTPRQLSHPRPKLRASLASSSETS